MLKILCNDYYKKKIIFTKIYLNSLIYIDIDIYYILIRI